MRSGHLSIIQNLWATEPCAKAFWSQQELPPYRRLLADTIAWADPKAGERWLDLGCGRGVLAQSIWEKSEGRVAQVIGVDCAAVNADHFQRLRGRLGPVSLDRLRFVRHNFNEGLNLFADGTFHHAVSGLSISYADSLDTASGAWTTAAYDRLLAEVARVLAPGGRFVFSVNVPEPSWAKVGFRSLTGIFRCRRPLRYLVDSWRMLRYGRWLKQEARRGRFHFLPWQTVTAKLQAAGFAEIEHRLSYAGQAYVFRARKPVPTEAADAW